ncbi:hypothetical protein [Vibrio mediterranei]|uniref:hypothetical protein n=1 Tax=Vibrio mediterranei TaxID=689 RepID=UPI0040687AA4
MKTTIFDNAGIKLTSDLRVHVLYHGRCADGTTSGLVCKFALQDRCILTFQASHYGMTAKDYDIAPNVDVVLMVDFSMKPDELDYLAERHTVIVLDHHDGAIKALKGYRNERVSLYMDATKAGALMTWEAFFTDKAPAFIEHISDGDLFNFKHPNTRAFVLGVVAAGFGMDDFEAAYNEPYEQVLQRGQRLLDYRNSLIYEAAQDLFWVKMNVDGTEYEVPIASSSRLMHSYLGEYLYEELKAPFVIVASLSKHGYGLSFRSSKAFGIPVTPIAQRFGGDGHPNAAGGRADSLSELGELIHVDKALPKRLDVADSHEVRQYNQAIINTAKGSAYRMDSASLGSVMLAPTFSSTSDMVIDSLVEDDGSYAGYATYKIVREGLEVRLKHTQSTASVMEMLLNEDDVTNVRLDGNVIVFVTQTLSVFGELVEKDKEAA